MSLFVTLMTQQRRSSLGSPLSKHSGPLAHLALGKCLEGLRDGTIDVIATDHAPHHADEKALEYDEAPFGIVGLETSVGLALDRLVKPGVISLERFIELCSVNPARILALENYGTLRAGARADLTIMDPELTWTFDVSRTKSK